MDREFILRIVLSVFAGAIIGFEREYRSKAAGFRTITIITLGSTLFTILSYKLGAPNNPDRIASNIITGIGFIGAGVIFKDGFSVSGLTTAATIWVSAAVGMAIGIGEYILAGTTVIMAIIVLGLFERIQYWIEAYHQVRTYKIYFKPDFEIARARIEKELQLQIIQFRMTKIVQTEKGVVMIYVLAGSMAKLDNFSLFLAHFDGISFFEE